MTITSSAENSFVFALVDDPAYWTQTANDHGPWIGGYQQPGSIEPGGGWTWLPRKGVSTPEMFSFANWETGEPNSLTAVVNGKTYNEDRIAFFHAGTGRASTWCDEFDLTGSELNRWTKSYVIEFGGTPAILVQPQRLADSSIQLSFTNTPGAFFEVMKTTNAALPSYEWQVLGTATETAPGQFEFTDVGATNSARGFYRVRTP